MPGYDDFTKLVIGLGSDYMSSLHAQYSEELREGLGSILFEQPLTRVANQQLTPKQRFFLTISNGYIEIRTAFEALKDFEVMVTRFPFAKSRIKRSRYLRFIIESYLAEAYILKERMISYLRVIGRLYKGHIRHSEVLSATRPMFKLVKDSLKPLTEARSLHVHQMRYEDNELLRLDLLELLSNKGNEGFHDVIKRDYDEAWRRYRGLWKTRFGDNNIKIGILLDHYFETLKNVLFEADGQLKPHAT